MTETTPLETILSQRGEAVSEQTPAVETVAQQAAPEVNVVQETQDPSDDAIQDEAGSGTVPHAALHAERQKARSYREELAESRRVNEETRRALEEQRRFNMELAQRIQPAQQQQPAPDFYEDPAAATRHTVQPEFERISQTLMANAQLIASVKYGDDKVEEAERAFITAVQSQSLDPADYQKVVNSPNRYAAAVQWHQRQLAQQEIGGDPAAYKAKLEAEIREKVLAELQQGGGQQVQQHQGTMPSNFAAARNVGARTGPAWSGPATLQDIFDRKRASG